MEMDTGTGFLDINIYLTRGLNPDQVTNVYLSAADASDPITELRSHTRYGRPDFDASLRRIQDEHRARNKVEAKSSQGVHDVGVFLCGPEALKNTVRKACDRATNKEFEFHFHAEKF